ncbi:MAG TPA: NmrA family NAD(P)-binding protein, partial [Acidobacteriota bacterium]|nr:NmrA family NAD(P)-binding protein [Acidobacteriota bacterium]
MEKTIIAFEKLKQAGPIPADGGMMYVITGATGNIGKVIAETLLSRGEKVRVLGRDEKRLESFVDRG